MPERVFLDANVLFSAAYREGSGLTKLWKLTGVELVTSEYASAEARLNLDTTEQRTRLDSLLCSMRVVGESDETVSLPAGIKLPEKDRPILRAAIHAGAAHLLTGDQRHFGPYFGKRIAGVTIHPPADYLRTR